MILAVIWSGFFNVNSQNNFGTFWNLLEPFRNISPRVLKSTKDPSLIKKMILAIIGVCIFNENSQNNFGTFWNLFEILHPESLNQPRNQYY